MRRVSPFACLLLVLLILASCGVDSGKFRLEGRLRNMNMGEFWVYSPEGDIDGIDTIRVRDGRFAYEIPLRSPSTLVVIFPNYSEQPVFAEPGTKVDIKGDASHLKEIIIKGTDDNDDMTGLRQELNRLMPPDVPKKVEAFIRENPESRVSIYLLQRYFLLDERPDYKKASELVAVLLKEQPDNGQLIRWKKELPALQNGGINSMMTAFSAKDVKGRPVSQDDLKHKVNVLSAWASWNYTSTDMQRRLQQLKKKHGEQLGVVSICLDGRPGDCKQRVERDSLPWKTVCDGRMWQTPLLAKFGIADIPANLLINENGRIIARDLSPQQLEEHINDLLKK